MYLKKIFLVSTLALTVALSGCSNNDYDPIPANESPMLTEALPLKLLWENSLSGDESIYSVLKPAVSNGVIYAAGREGEIKALDLNTGKELWKTQVNKSGFFSSDNAQLSGGISLDSTLLLVGSEKGILYALDRQTGELIWEESVQGEVISMPVLAGDKIALHTGNGQLQLRERNTGHLLWKVSTDKQALSIRGASTPVVTRDRVIVGTSNGRLLSYTLNEGHLVWQQRISQPRGTNELARLSDVIVSPLVDGNSVYAAGFSGLFASMNFNNGELKWKTPLSTTTDFTLGYDTIYVIDDHSRIIALNQYNGQEMWKQDELLNRRLTPPVIIKDKLFVGDFEGYLYEVNRENGQLISKKQINKKGLLTAPIYVEDHVVLQSRDGRLYVFSVAL